MTPIMNPVIFFRKTEAASLERANLSIVLNIRLQQNRIAWKACLES